MLFERDLTMTHTLNYKKYFIIVTRDEEGLMLRWNFPLGTYVVLPILKCVRKYFSSKFGKISHISPIIYAAASSLY